MTRSGRLNLITELLSRGPVANQEALVVLLGERGVTTTQATLSRDLRELGVVKTAEGYVLPSGVLEVAGGGAAGGSVGGAGADRGVGGGSSTEPEGVGARPGLRGLAATGSLVRALSGHLTGVREGVGLVVCTTAPGHAQVIALELDRTPPEGVIGTVGGDDTVFVAVSRAGRVSSLAAELRAMGGLARAGAGAGAGDGGVA